MKNIFVSIAIFFLSTNAYSVSVSEDFDDGLAQGWSLDGLWHVTDNAPYGATGFALGYVKDETSGPTPNGNFDTGSANSGTALSPNASCIGPCLLSFDYIKDTEAGTIYDTMDISIIQNSTDFFATTITSASSAYQPFSFDLTTLVGLDTTSLFNVEFFFDTADLIGNDGAGVRIDNFSVGTPVSAVPVPAAVWLFGSAIAGFAGFSRFNKKT